MKGVLGFVKSNLVSVIAVAVAILAIPAAIYFSGQMNAGIRESVESDARSAMNKLRGLEVTYEVPAVAGGEAWTRSGAPSLAWNRAVGEVLEARQAAIEEARSAALERNAAGRELLVGEDGDALFPAPANESARVRLLTEFRERWRPAHAELLEEARMRPAPSPASVRDRLSSLRLRLLSQRGIEGEPDEETAAEIAEQLGAERLAIYRRAAEGLTAYAAGPGLFAGVAESADPALAGGLPTVEEAWERQAVYWVHEDVVAGLRSANEEGGVWRPVFEAPVKRVLSVSVRPHEAPAMGAGGGRGAGAGGGGNPFGGGGRDGRGGGFGGEAAGGPPAGEQSLTAPVQRDFSAALTGRAGWPIAANGYFDVRYADVSVVVDPNRLPEVFAGLASAGYLTVTSYRLSEVSAAEALEEGYVYGPQAVMRLDMTVEALYLRAWMQPWMPASVRARLGVPAPAETEPDAGLEGEGSGAMG